MRIAACVLLVAACSEGGRSATTTSSFGTPRQGATVTTVPVDATPLDCRDPIANLAAPKHEYQVIGNAVALVTSRTSNTALQTSATGDANPAHRLYAKNGLLVRTNTRSELIVPPQWRNRLSFRWGNAGAQNATEELVVGPCDGDAPWIAFPGGYVVADPACVDFIVRAPDGDHRVSVGVGAPCAGQREPVQPSDT
jgi:hypothetical protein